MRSLHRAVFRTSYPWCSTEARRSEDGLVVLDAVLPALRCALPGRKSPRIVQVIVDV